jgi:excisionase family DNA binding protein
MNRDENDGGIGVPQIAPSDGLLSLSEVAKILGVCVRSVRRAIARKELPPPVRVGRAVRLFRRDVAAYLQRLREQRGV